MPEPLPLRALQTWMLAVLTHPAGVAAGAAAAGDLQLEDVIQHGPQQSAAERMAVYSSAYLARLLEVLRELFPCLRFAVGDEVFDQFALGYLRRHPPASYTLHRLADQFAEFLEATRPQEDAATGFVVDLVRLEHAIDQVFDGPGPEPGSGVFCGNDPSIIASDSTAKDSRPPRVAPQVRLIPGFRLLAFRFPVSTYFTAWKAGERASWPEPQPQYIALLRRDYVVRRHELTAAQYELLGHLAAGRSLDDSLAAIAGEAELIDALSEDVRRWFTHWAAAGFFTQPAPISAPDRPWRLPADTATSE